MIKKYMILTLAIALSACADMDKPVGASYEKQPPLNYNMNCKQIVQALNEAKASLGRIKARREEVNGEDAAFFILSAGLPNMAGPMMQKEAEDRIALLEGVAMQRRCTVK